jgi:hypothetical protein
MSNDTDHIKCECPHCHVTYRAAPKRINTEIACPKCKNKITVVAIATPAPTTTPVVDASVATRCTSCEEVFNTAAQHINTLQECPYCHYPTPVHPVSVDKLVVACPRCNTRNETRTTKINTAVSCYRCKHRIPVVAAGSLSYAEEMAIYQFHHQQWIDAARARQRVLGWFAIVAAYPLGVFITGFSTELGKAPDPSAMAVGLAFGLAAFIFGCKLAAS